MKTFSLKSLSKEQKIIRLRVIEISYGSRLSHIGSCISAIDIINEIYKIKKRNEKFILSNGHAGIALYVILEKNGFIKNSHIKNFHIHPDRNPKLGIDVSTGSLGQGLPIALGMAISDRNKNYYCLISDGECAEGSIWEALRIKTENKISNLKVYVNLNGYGAYGKIDSLKLIKKLKIFCPDIIIKKTNVEQFPFLKGQDAHYYIMTKNDYEKAIKLLNV